MTSTESDSGLSRLVRDMAIQASSGAAVHDAVRRPKELRTLLSNGTNFLRCAGVFNFQESIGVGAFHRQAILRRDTPNKHE